MTSFRKETRGGYVQGSSSTSDGEEDLPVTAKGKKKSKKGPKAGAKQQGDQKKHMSKVRWGTMQ